MAAGIAEAFHERDEYRLATSCREPGRRLYRNGERGAAYEQGDYRYIRPAQPERVEQKAADYGANDLRGIAPGPGESDGVTEVVARHHVCHEGLARDIIEGAHHACHARENEDVPDLNQSKEGERGDYEGDDGEDYAGYSQEHQAVVAVHDDAIEGREEGAGEAKSAVQSYEKGGFRACSNEPHQHQEFHLLGGAGDAVREPE